MRTLTVAVVSSRSRFGDKSANLRHFETLIRRESTRGAELVCFPELALTGYAVHPRLISQAEAVPGPSTAALGKIAARYNVHLSVGIPEKDGRNHYLTQVVVGPRGYLGKYRKHHLTPAERKCGFSTGTGSLIFQIHGFRIGINICYDGRYPGTIERMRRLHADIVLHPHGNSLRLGRNAEEWTRGKLVYIAPRARRARAYILGNNSAGNMAIPGGTTRFGSGAFAIDPSGQVLCRTRQRTRTEKSILVTLR